VRLIVDTNVLVRYLTWDDEAQATASADAIETADEIIIPTIVLCETAWVLKRSYRHRADEIAAALRRVVESRNVVADRPAAEAGLAMMLRGGDFADGVIAFDLDRHAAARIVTLDRDFARLHDPQQVVPLTA
jgi:predicted nucleic-acid-binding protein